MRTDSISDARARLMDDDAGRNITIDYDQRVCPYHTRIAELVVAEFDNTTSESLNVFDYGCGVGNTIRELQRLAPGHFAFSIYDIDPRCLNAAARITGVRYRYDSTTVATALAGGDAFDVVICSHVLHYDYNFRTTVETLKHMVRPGGLMVIAVPNVTSLPIIANSLLRRSYGKGPVIAWDWSAFENMLASSGFPDVRLATDYVPLPLLGKLPGIRTVERRLAFVMPRFGFTLIAVCRNGSS